MNAQEKLDKIAHQNHIINNCIVGLISAVECDEDGTGPHISKEDLIAAICEEIGDLNLAVIEIEKLT